VCAKRLFIMVMFKPRQSYEERSQLILDSGLRRDAHVHFVSPGVVAMPKNKAGFSKEAVVSDPDGHDVLLIEKVSRRDRIRTKRLLTSFCG
jgi:hypothetical protein